MNGRQMPLPMPPGWRKDAYGNVLADGDIVAMIKDLKLKGSSEVLKTGTKSKPIRLVDGDHEISCKMEGNLHRTESLLCEESQLSCRLAPGRY